MKSAAPLSHGSALFFDLDVTALSSDAISGRDARNCCPSADQQFVHQEE